MLEGLPWKLMEQQLLAATRTLYVGGSAAYETVEDCMQYVFYFRFLFRRSLSNLGYH